ncbi:hypothetical protein ACTE87_004560 [Escherichia albertii]|nr:hypothetical protein FYK23_02875 [Escherichia albertii]
MRKMIKMLIVLLAILAATSILGGAGVEFTETWYLAPETFSKFIVTIITIGVFTKISVKVCKMLD